MLRIKTKFKILISNIERVKRRIKYKGYKETYGFFKNEYLFDFKRGIETKYVTSLSELDMGNTIGCHMYMAVVESAFKKAFSFLPKESLDYEFIDFGSGKGRGLILGYEYGFKKIAGIEFSNDLCKFALKNIDKLQLQNVKIYNADARDYQFENGNKVIFFNNPFGEEILKQVIENINKFIKVSSSKVYIVYLNPTLKYLFTEDKYKLIHFIDDDTNNSATIYESI